jgi:hypothetical protein
MDLSRVKLYFAITALIVAFVSIVCFFIEFHHIALWGSVFSLLLGFVTLLIPLRRPMVLRPSFYAVFAIILSLPLVSFFATAQYGVWARQKIEREHTLLYNMKLLRKSLQRYVKANDGYLPDANSWADSLMKEDPSLDLNSFRHPEDPDVRVAYNVNLSGLKLSSILTQDVALFFPAEGGHNLAGAQELLDSMTKKTLLSIMLLNRRIQTYEPEHRGVRELNGTTFVPVMWIPVLIDTGSENEGQP